MEKLGINPLLILTQVFNFFVLLFVLKKYLYKPILAMLDKRRDDVARTVDLKQELEQQKTSADKEKEAAVQEGRREAERILKEAQAKGEGIIKQLEDQARTKSDEIMVRGKEQLKLQEQEVRTKLSAEVSKAAIEAAHAVLQQTLTEAQKQKVLDESVKRFAAHA